MALHWTSDRRRRAMLAALDVLCRVFPSLAGDRSATSIGNRDVRSVLVIEPWNIGDIILMIPFLRALRRKFPAATITLLARPHASEILKGTGLVDSYIETDLGWSEEETRSNPFAYRWQQLLRTAVQLRRHRFDIAFKSRMHIREHVLLALSRANRRVAFAFGIGDRALTDPLDARDSDRHKTQDWLALLEPFGAVSTSDTSTLAISAEEQQWAIDFLSRLSVRPGSHIIGVHPGASIAGKRWPLENFRHVSQVLVERGETVIAFAEPGGYGEQLGEVRGIALAKVSLRQMIALIARCEILVCNDSGPMHIAGVLGVPVVAIFGTGISPLFAPLGGVHRLITSPSSSGGTRSRDLPRSDPYDVGAVRVEQVMDAIDELLAPPSSRD